MTMTAAERLALLLPLANNDTLSDADVRKRLTKFLNGFETSGLRVAKDAGMWDAYRDAPPAELKAVQRKIQLVFATAFLFERPAAGTRSIGIDDIAPPLSFPSLRFAALWAQRGRYTFIVDAARLRDLVPYLAMQLLITGDAAVSRCSAPQYRNYAERCNRFVVWKGQGRPPKVCADPKCVARVKAEKKKIAAEVERKNTEAWARAYNIKSLRRQGGKKR